METARTCFKADPDATREAIAARFRDWPKYWFGSANAWLVFLGPSPGNSRGAGVDWEKDGPPTLGWPHNFFIKYHDSTGFWARMGRWTVEAYNQCGLFCNDDVGAIGSALMGNVIATKEGDSTRIDSIQPAKVMPATVDMLELIKPRIIVPMEKRVSRLLRDELRKRPRTREMAELVSRVSAKNQRFAYYQPHSWDFSTKFGPLRVAESPQHPSKRNFYEPSVVDAYLAKMMKACLVGK